MSEAGLAPLLRQLAPPVARFDQRVDRAFEPLRGQPTADAVFTAASALGDWSLIWHLTGIARGVTGRRRAEQSLVLAALLGVESLTVNQGIKRLTKRARPTVDGLPGLQVRRPSTSSFPSGHASAGAFAAIMLTSFDGRRTAPLWWAMATVVAASRIHVGIHHASDIIAGAAVGTALGLAARRAAQHILT